MKKIIAFVLAALLLASVAALPAFSAEEFSYAHIVAGGNDPYGTLNFSAEGKNTSIDPDVVKWAVIKYRTVTETDSTGVQLIGQFYISPAVEPFVPIKYNHTRQWETLVVDLTSVSEKTALPSAWNSAKYSDKTTVRFVPLESNRDAEAQDGENDVARVQEGDSIDIAFIAFFDNEEDANAYDGTQDTPYCIILPEDIEWYTAGNAIEDVEVVDAKKPRPADDTTQAETEKETEAETEKETEAVTDKETEVETNEATEAVTDTETEADNGSTTTAEATETAAPEVDYKTAAFPGWAIAIIAAAGAVLVAAIIVIIAKNKKK